jgi:hypothetical protein
VILKRKNNKEGKEETMHTREQEEKEEIIYTREEKDHTN